MRHTNQLSITLYHYISIFNIKNMYDSLKIRVLSEVLSLISIQKYFSAMEVPNKYKDLQICDLPIGDGDSNFF